MILIIGIAGSLREESFNLRLLREAKALSQGDCELEIHSLEGIPLYNGDIEAAEGIPPAVRALQGRIAASDGWLIASPEYNNSIPGVLKNAVDWLSRPPAELGRVFRGRAVAVIGATPGGMGTAFAQTAWLSVFRALGAKPWFGQTLYLSGAHKVFDAAGRLQDESIRERLRTFIAGFAAFAAGEPTPPGASRPSA